MAIAPLKIFFTLLQNLATPTTTMQSDTDEILYFFWSRGKTP
jgi:hypothetical protein